MYFIDFLTKEEKALIQYKLVNKETVLFHEKETCNFLCIVISGEIAITSTTIDGDEIVYNYLTKNMVFGNNLLFSSTPFYKGDVIAKTTAELALISKKDVIFLLKNNEIFLKEFLRYQSDFGKKLNSKIKLLSLPKLENKIMFLLEENDGVITFKSITSLSKILNVKRETLSRIIKSLSLQKKIIKSGHKITLIK